MVLSEGWPQGKELDLLLKDLISSKRGSSEALAIRYYCQKSSSTRMCFILFDLIRKWSSTPEYRRCDEILGPLLKRLQKDAGVIKRLMYYLNVNKKISQKISISKLIYKSSGLTPELKKWAEKELKAQLASKGFDVGYDITTGDFVSVPETLYEILS